MIGSLGSALAALSFLGLAGGAFAAPRALAATYGLPVESDEGEAYVRALGARDGVLGLIILMLLASGARGPLRTTIGLSSLVAAADLTIVVTARGLAAKRSLAIHGGGVLGFLALWSILQGDY